MSGTVKTMRAVGLEAPGTSGDALAKRASQAARWLADVDYRGWDPYDGLNGPIARFPPINRQPMIRFALQQLVKRSPINVRPLLQIPRGINPVTLALSAQAHAYLASTGWPAHGASAATAGRLVERLASERSQGWHGSCWGYDFDWQARRLNIPARCPTIVATGIVTNSLFEVHRLLSHRLAGELVVDALPFLEHDLNRTRGEGPGFCWSYSPNDRLVVLNAAMKGARLCTQVASLTGEPHPHELARAVVEFVVHRQRPDGSWPYAVGDNRSWADNFHTGYVLDALHVYAEHDPRRGIGDALKRGFAFYRENFFSEDWAPKYYPDRRYPIDATAAGQSLLTLCTFGAGDAARAVAAWVGEHMSNRDGSFAYQVRRWGTIRTRFPRWSVAWLCCGLARVATLQS